MTITADVEQYRRADGSYDLTDGQGVYAGTEHVTITRSHPNFWRDGEARYSVVGTKMYRPLPGGCMTRTELGLTGGLTLESALALAAFAESTYAQDAEERALRDEDERLGRWTLNGRPVKEGRTYRVRNAAGYSNNRTAFVYLDTNESDSLPTGQFNGKLRCRRCGRGINSCKCQ